MKGEIKEKVKNEIKERVKNIPAKIIPQLVFQSLSNIAIALSSFVFLTWLVADVFGVTNTYTAVLYEIIGTLVILVLTLAPLNVILYRSREREVVTLSTAIKKVAGGDYKSKIPTDKKHAITPIYEDFNRMCAELESVQILRNDFINSYSHEFKTPIASINGFASLLLEKDLPEEERRQYLEIIVDESARLSRLATNTILLSKLTAQQIVTDTEEYDLSEQLRACSIILSQKWLEKKIDFNADLTEVRFVGNKEMLKHLWLNLLENAVKYTPVGGEITIRNFLTEKAVTVQITDTGEGMDEEILNHLFDPYYQGDSSHASQGLGLGLSIAKRIVELCGGEISVKSELAIGSTFTVLLPIAKP
jgi:signal transduction histidine kinase